MKVTYAVGTLCLIMLVYMILHELQHMREDVRRLLAEAEVSNIPAEGA